MLAAVPALWALRDNFPDAHITLLSDRQIGGDYVTADSVLGGSGLVDEFMTYPVGGSIAQRAVGLLGLLRKLRCKHFDAMAYLAPSYRTASQAARDRRFFRAAGVPVFFGMEGFESIHPREVPKPLPLVPQEADQLLARLSRDGLRVPPAGKGNIDIRLCETEAREVVRWKETLPGDGNRRWVGVGIGGKQPVNLWPESRYNHVVAALIERFDVWPVIFGGNADRDAGDRLVAAWGRGYNAAGALNVRAAMMSMRSCSLYVGNDTGTTHMAAAAGVKCVAVFSSREAPGLWYPYGEGHRVFRTQIECEGCRLSDCIERRHECILTIQPAEVIAACAAVLAK